MQTEFVDNVNIPTKASVIIPAHNEANVIGRCLQNLLSSSKPGEFEIIVACNGCTDDTVDVVRESFPLATVIESRIASKVAALNEADKVAKFFPRIYLDADLSVTSDNLRNLIEPLQTGDALASCGRMEIDTSRSSLAVKAFYEIWQLNTYFDGGKFGGLFAVSRIGHERISPFPKITNDDELVRRKFTPSDRAYIKDCSFTMTAPQKLEGLIKIRSRAIRGSVELDELGYSNSDGSFVRRGFKLLGRILNRPSTWSALPFYIFISAYIRLRVAVIDRSERPVWERDDSSREYV